MKRNALRTKGAALAAMAVLSIGTFAVGGTVEATAYHCTGGLPSSGGTYTGSMCEALTSGTVQRSSQWCPATSYGYQKGTWKSTSGAWSNTAACPLTPNNRDQEIS